MSVFKKLLLSIWFYPILFCLCVGIFLVHYAIAGQAVYGDGIDYWAYLPTVYFQHNVDFSNAFRHVYNHEYNNGHSGFLSPIPQKTAYTKEGKVDDVHPPGTAVMMLPFFVIADGIVIVVRIFHSEVLRNGYSDIYQIVVGIGQIGYAMSALWLMEQTVKKMGVSAHIARLSTLTVFGATTLLYYGAFDVLNSHAPSLFVLALFWYLLLGKSVTTLWRFAIYGFLLGLLCMLRLQDVTLLLPFVVLTFVQFRSRLWQVYKPLVVTGIVGFLIVLPMFILWHWLYGGVLQSSYYGGFHAEPVLASLFDIQNGLLTKTPFVLVLLIAYPFVLFVWKPMRLLLALFGVYFCLQVLLLAAHGGWIGAAYGGRMYLNCTFFFILLYAYVLTYMKKRWKHEWLLSYTCAFFVFYNMLSIGSFVLTGKRTSGTIPGMEQSTLKRLRNLVH